MSRLLRLKSPLRQFYHSHFIASGSHDNVYLSSVFNILHRGISNRLSYNPGLNFSTSSQDWSNSIRVKHALRIPVREKKHKTRKKRKTETAESCFSNVHQDLTEVLNARLSFLNQHKTTEPSSHNVALQEGVNTSCIHPERHSTPIKDVKNLSVDTASTSPNLSNGKETLDYMEVSNTTATTADPNSDSHFTFTNHDTTVSNPDWQSELSNFKLQFESMNSVDGKVSAEESGEIIKPDLSVLSSVEDEPLFTSKAKTPVIENKNKVKRKSKSAKSQNLEASDQASNLYEMETVDDHEMPMSSFSEDYDFDFAHSALSFYPICDDVGDELLLTTKLSKDRNKNTEKKQKNINAAKMMANFNVDKKYFVEACCAVGLHRLAHNSIKYYINYPTKSNGVDLRITDVEIYNTLIHSWAKQSKIDHVMELLTFIKKDNLVPNHQTYAGCLECLGRAENIDTDACEFFLEEMKAEGCDVKDLFNNCVCKSDERQFIIKAIQCCDPNYKPNPPTEPQVYSGGLLSSLNTKLPRHEVKETNPYAGILSTEELKQRAKLQMESEISGTVTVQSIFKKNKPTKQTLDMRKKLSTAQEEWRASLLHTFKRKLRIYQRKSERDHAYNIYPFLKLLSPQEYVDCILHEINDISGSSETYSPRLSFLRKRLGNRVFQHCLVKEKMRSGEINKIKELYEIYMEEFNNEDFPYVNHRQCWHQILNSNPDGPSLDVKEKIWPVHVKRTIGRVLYDMILQDLKIDTNIFKTTDEKKMVPAFYSIYRNYSLKTVEEIKPNPLIVKLYKGAELDNLTFNVSEMPMLVPPVPWLSLNHGGTLLSSTKLIRLPELAQSQEERLHQTGSQQINPVLDSLNTLAACAWIINKPILDLIIGLFNNKGNQSLDIPPPLSEFPVVPKYPRNFKTMSHEEKVKLHRTRNQIRQLRMEMFSLWCTELYRLSIANKYRDEIFWFPHNMDFRGRTYPTPPYFNHLGSDLARSLLVFAKGKPLGERGLDWLKIHLVNLTGLRKRSSNDERLAFAEEMLEEIIDSADNPFNGRGWWQKSDEPWQTLACCKEIANALRSPNPTKYICHFPVHQDGSCNGLQHYAALGRDLAGAESVNLSTFPRPQDVYSDVAEMVERLRQKDANEGEQIASVLEGFVRRKVIKQTVMTTVYGVTKYGARLQILRQLKDIPEFPQEHAWQATSYLTEKTFHCLQEMFTSTKGIQEWLRMCARVLASESNQPVEWVTPLGLSIIQPYHKLSKQQQHGVTIQDNSNHHEKPNIRKQMNAFPPNFIHSLDSTHMMLTSLYCLHAGITYVSVHDCYWTHAVDVPIMNRICREQFVNLHNQPILEDLSNYLVKTFLIDRNTSCPDTMDKVKDVLTDVPERGNFDLSNVLNSTYFFS